MNLYDWLVFLHVLSAFALVGAITAFWALALATRPAGSPLHGAPAGRFARPTTPLIIAGTLGTLVFGVWLAIEVDGYELWDGWILAALVLWALSGWLGDRTGKAFTRSMAGGPEAAEARRSGLRFQGALSVVVLIILVLMIWKPGA